MTWPSLLCILGSIVFLLAFLAAVVFVDPAVYYGAEELDFCGLTSVFFTLDMLPLVFLLFSNDAKVNDKSPYFQLLSDSAFGRHLGPRASACCCNQYTLTFFTLPDVLIKSTSSCKTAYYFVVRGRRHQLNFINLGVCRH